MDHRFRKFAVAVVSAAAMTGAGMDKAAAQQKTTVVLGTATPGGGFQVYGAAYSAVLNEMAATLAVEQRSTKGSTESAPLPAAGKSEIGQGARQASHERV